MSSWFERMYSDFLLRDFVAKIVPGGIVLLPVILLAFREYVLLIVSVSSVLTLGLVALLCGYSFVVGMLLQQLGEILKVVKYGERPNIEKDYKRMLRFGHKFDESDCYERMIKERLTIIKEMSGNMGMALALLAIQLQIYVFIDIIDGTLKNHELSSYFQFIVVVLVALSLLCITQNRDYHAREEKWMDRALRLSHRKRKRIKRG